MKKQVSVPSARINPFDMVAEQYDNMVKMSKSFAAEVMFGMIWQYLEKDQPLLDVGIGTGLGSKPFAEAGSLVYGMDGAKNMLEQCAKKGFAKELKHHDITETPWPYEDHTFPLIVSNDVVHFFGEIRFVFEQVTRLIKPKGIFVFNIATQNKSEQAKNKDYIEVPTSYGLPIFQHGEEYLNGLANENGFVPEKVQKLVLPFSEKDKPEIEFKVVVLRKQ